jgi:hypothetical protein
MNYLLSLILGICVALIGANGVGTVIDKLVHQSTLIARDGMF